MALLELDVKKRVGNFSMEAAFSLDDLGITVLFGPSGAGKTTLLNMIAGLTDPDSGRINCGGRPFFDSTQGVNLAPEKRGVGYVFQQHRLFPYLSVRNNVLFAPRFCGAARDEKFFTKVVDLLGIAPLLSRGVASLSGGESQRVAVGRALMALTQGSLLLMDEPLASLDEPRKRELLRYIATIPQKLGVSVLYVTHSPEEIRSLPCRVLHLKSGKTAFIQPGADFSPERDRGLH